jgi:hypothetical protein
MTRAQRLRHQKGLERAADNLDKMQVKVVKSLGKEKNIKERSKGWEDVNGDGTKKKKKSNVLNESDDDDADAKKEREWVSDEDMDDTATAALDSSSAKEGEENGQGKQVEAAIPESIPLPVVEDELL